MNMKRIVAALLACACAFSISVTSFAYDRSIIARSLTATVKSLTRNTMHMPQAATIIM